MIRQSEEPGKEFLKQHVNYDGVNSCFKNYKSFKKKNHRPIVSAYVLNSIISITGYYNYSFNMELKSLISLTIIFQFPNKKRPWLRIYINPLTGSAKIEQYGCI